MALQPVAAAVSTIGSAVSADVALNADGSLMYVSQTDGNISVYDTFNNQIISTINVGSPLGGIDISPDGSFVLAVDAAPVAPSGTITSTVHKINLITNQVFDFSQQLGGVDGPFYDVATFANGMAIVTTKIRGSGTTTTYSLDTTSGIFSALYGGAPQSPIVMSSVNRSQILLTNGFNVSGLNQIFSIDSQSQIHLDASRSVASSGNSLSAFSADGSLVAYVERQLGVDIFDNHFNKITTIAGVSGRDVKGVAFDVTGDYLYIILDSGSSHINIDKIDTATWSIVDVVSATGVPNYIFNNAGIGETLVVGPDSLFCPSSGHLAHLVA